MNFTEPVYLVFLATVLALYYCLARRAQNLMLLAASYLFYGFWDWRFLSLIWFSTLLDYLCGRGIEAAAGPRRRRAFLLASVILNLALLGFFKYFGFFAAGAHSLLRSLGLDPGEPALQILLPVGISFYTFQTMSYTIDVYRGRIRAERDPLDFALFVAFFPQLVAGPIERAGGLLPQFKTERQVTAAHWAEGGRLLLLGFFLKLAVADTLAPEVRAVFAAPGAHGWGMILSAAVLFGLQIYCDFAGYSHIARGTALFLGFALTENFRQPFLSASPAEFWRRWHITLSIWLKDYLYIPLGGNRRGRARTLLNLLLTMLLGGLWHGAALTYLIWGGLHGLYLCAHRLLGGGRAGERASPPGARLAGWLATFPLISLAWIFFQPDWSLAWGAFARLLCFRGDNHLHPWLLPALAVVLGLDFLQRRGATLFLARLPWLARGMAYAAALYACLLLGENHEPFVYFQF